MIQSNLESELTPVKICPSNWCSVGFFICGAYYHIDSKYL